MAKFRKTLTSIITLAMLAFSSGLIAQAAQAPSLVIASSGTSLAGTTISDFDAEETLRLELTTNSGEITIQLGSSGALVAPGASLKGATVGVIGTQAQINSAIATATLSQNCTSTRTITGKVTIGPDALAFNAANGHWYANVITAGISWDEAKIAAAAKTLPNSTGRGYLANITSAAENTFINDNFSNTPFIGASDAETEGDWFWMDGPEAGTKFFSNGAPVGDSFVKWGTNEPNNLFSNEDYGQLWVEDTWNDIATQNAYLVEFGGMAGDDFSGFVNLSASATKSATVPVLMVGAGTKTSPYLVTNALDFADVESCSGAGVYFQQTQDIAFVGSFSGLGSFSGHYDGNGNDLDISGVGQTVSGRGSIFGNISGTTLATDSSVSDLNVIGHQVGDFNFDCLVLAGSINKATIDNVHLSGSKIQAECRTGLFASNISNSVIKNSSVTGEIDVMEDRLFFAGGLAATVSGSQILNVNCNIAFVQSEMMPIVDTLVSVGGCVGRSSTSSYINVHSTGSLNFDSQELRPRLATQIGGLIGESYIDQISNSSSSTSINLSQGDGLGGLIGLADLSTISRSFATGSVNAPGSYAVGGLIGYAIASTINNVYATGAVSAEDTSGSLIGNMQGTTLTNAYATGLVSVTNAGGSRGLVGNSNSPDLVDSYWKILTNGVPSTIESFGQEVPKHAGELKRIATFANWKISATPNSDHDWAICPEANGGYPYLAWQRPANACSRSFKPGAAATVTGLAYVGSSITATPASWDPLATLSYQWLDGTTPIAGATTAVLPLNAALKGKSLSVRVTGSKLGYISSLITSTPVVVAGPPTNSTGIVGGFASKSSKLGSTSKAAVTKTLKGLGLVLQIKCEGFFTAKKLSASQKKLATSRAASVCAALMAKHTGATVKTSSTLAKKSDKVKEGVRVTITQVKR